MQKYSIMIILVLCIVLVGVGCVTQSPTVAISRIDEEDVEVSGKIYPNWETGEIPDGMYIAELTADEAERGCSRYGREPEMLSFRLDEQYAYLPYLGYVRTHWEYLALYACIETNKGGQ